MSLLFLFLLIATDGFAQSLLIGAKGGVPVTAGFSTDRVSYSSVVKRYTLGPTADIALPWKLRLEVDALYRRTGWDIAVRPTLISQAYQSTVRIGAWDFAALPKRGFRRGSALRPYAGA